MSVYEDKQGVWWAVIENGFTAAGKRRRIKRRAKATGDKGKQEAQSIERRLLRARNAGTLSIDQKMTVKRYSGGWLARESKRVRPRYWEGLAAMVRHILPVCGSVRLDGLSAAHVRAVADAVSAAGNTSTTARDVQQRFVKMLRDAVRDGYKVPEAALKVVLPARAASVRDAIPVDLARAMLTTATKLADDDPSYPASRWIAALLYGMRQGECLGLTWDHVDFTRGVIDVSWQLQPVRYSHGCNPRCGKRYGGDCPNRVLQMPDGYAFRRLDGALCLVPPKTKAGRRVIPMVPLMAAVLTDWKAKAPASPHGLVWPRPDGRPQTKRMDGADWTALQLTAKIPTPAGRYWDLHEARHTAATLLLELGVDPHTVTAIMGHSSIMTSRGYQHVSQSLALDALTRGAEKLGLPSASC